MKPQPACRVNTQPTVAYQFGTTEGGAGKKNPNESTEEIRRIKTLHPDVSAAYVLYPGESFDPPQLAPNHFFIQLLKINY